MLKMNSGDQLTLDVISKLDARRITVKQAMQILNKSESSIFRKLARYRAEGPKFVKHKNTNKTPKNKTPCHLEQKIIELCNKKYFDFNRTHAWEEIVAVEQIEIPKNTFMNICKRNELLMKKVKKRKPKNRYRRDRMKQKGIMLQLDGSPHRWFGMVEAARIEPTAIATLSLFNNYSPEITTFFQKTIPNCRIFDNHKLLLSVNS